MQCWTMKRASGTVKLWEALLRVLPKETSSPEEGRGPQAKRSGKESLKARPLKSAQKDEENAELQRNGCNAELLQN